jgi:hypothetical protein
MVVDLGVNWAELLKSLHAPKPLHGPLSPSKWLMGILRSVVETMANLVAVGDA